jgi:hypothetical protein
MLKGRGRMWQWMCWTYLDVQYLGMCSERRRIVGVTTIFLPGRSNGFRRLCSRIYRFSNVHVVVLRV